jgi:4-amino-4-deoxy-L-arabinose transferase-like glycosyltransferase
LAAIALLADRVFEHVPHSEDEVAYIFQARVLAQNRLAVSTPANASAFWTPFVVDDNDLRFGKYPPGWPALLSLGVRVGAPWLVNAWLGVFSLVLVGWLGRCFYRPGVGLAAAGLGLVTPAFLFLSSSLLSHTASLFWATVALVALYYAVTARPLYALVAGLALGAAFVTRPFAGLGIGLAVGLFLLGLVLRGELRWPVLFWLALGWLPAAGLLPLYWWAVTGDPGFNAYVLVWPYDRIGFGPDIGPYGYGWREAILINTRLKLVTLATGLFGWPGWSNLLFMSIPFVTRRANRWDWLLLGTIAGIIIVHIFYWAFGGADGGFPRYYYDALPAFLLLTGRGLWLSIEYLNRLAWPRSGGKLKLGWLPAGLVLLFIGYNFIWNLPPLLAAQKGKYGITPRPLQVVEQANLAEPALVFVKNVDSWSDFAAPFGANSPTLDGPVVYAIDRGPTLNHKVRAQFRARTCWELAGINLSRCKPISE